MDKKSCWDCGYCNEFPEHSFCECQDKGTHELKTYDEAIKCKYYDDDGYII